jgi:RNA polymerase sigma-70 factor, ECF subfamily
MRYDPNVVPLRGRESVAASAPNLERRDDDELMLLTRGGVQAAFETLVTRHQTMVVGLAAKYLQDAVLAEDVAQNAFVDLYRFVPRYLAAGRLRALLCRMTLSRCAMARRSLGYAQRARADLMARPAPDPDLPDDAVLQRERRREIERALATLSDKLRSVVILRLVADLSYAEIAETVGIPEGTVKSRLFAGLRELRRLLAEQRP